MELVHHVNRQLELTSEAKKSILTRFIDWCGTQEEKRMYWLAIGLTGHGCVITPLTLGIVMITGNHLIFWPFVIAAMTMCLVTNLAALPAKITIPVFLFSLLIDLAVIVISLSNGFSISITP